MSAISRFGPSMAKAMFAQQHRYMASASGSQLDPVQKLFIEKIREFKTSNKGLDERHQKIMEEEMKRLKHVYSIEDENKLAHISIGFSKETQVSLHDLDTTKELREKVYSGEYQRQLADTTKPRSALLESIRYREPDEFHLPLMNKPNTDLVLNPTQSFSPPELSEPFPDYMRTEDKVTPQSLHNTLRTVFGPKMPTIDDDKSPERDLVNFPRQPQPLDTPPTVAHIIPYSWFKFFHPKTGLTGPYAFGVGFTTFLLSKEWLVVEHEIVSGVAMILLFSWLLPKFGPTISNYINSVTKSKVDGWDNWQQGTIKTLNELKEILKAELPKGALIDELYQARKQDVENQLEVDYRRRLKTVYDDTRRRLNYLVAVADSKRQVQQNHLVSWVINSVHSSIGPKQEEEYLNTCIANLKLLSQKNANSI